MCKTSEARHQSINTMICKSGDAAIAVAKIMVQASGGGVWQASDRRKAVDG
jgi:hypothetical protein